MRLIDLELRTHTIWISCKFDARVVATIKTIPGREYDNRTKRWSAPMSSIALVVERLEPLHFRFTPRMRDWWLENRDTEAVPAPDDEPQQRGDFDVDPADGYTVSRLNETARKVIAESFGAEVWVVGELDGFDRNKNKHAYFELIERVVAGGEPIARVGSVMFSSARERITEELGEALTLSDGMVVRARGRLDIYPAHGRFQFIIEAIDAEWSVGAMRRRRDEVLEKLEAKGILERNLGLRLPSCPLRIGLVTSIDSDAYNDFVHELERSNFAFEVTAVDARMQGRDTEASVVSALRWFADRAESFDAIVITRGGGSRSDLGFFDSLVIGEAVCRHPVKIISGIGHHRDRCVLDFVAHSEKTPTATAQLLVGRVAEMLDAIESGAARLEDAVARRLERTRSRVGRAGSSVERHVLARIRSAERRYERAVASVREATLGTLAHGTRRLDDAARDLERGALKKTREATRRVDRARTGIEVDALMRRSGRLRSDLDRLTDRIASVAAATMERRTLQVEHVESKLRLADPRRIVERGFALVRGPDGAIVTDAGVLKALGEARLEMRDGTVDVKAVGQGDGSRD